MRSIFIKSIGPLIGLLILSGFGFDTSRTVYLVGDSTMSVKDERYYPETGWGMPFKYFFDESVRIENRAMNGRSTRSFIEEKRWQLVSDSLKAGDYVLIQFGHNDEVATKKTYTDEVGYQANLHRFIKETKEKGAYPVLITPVARRRFDAKGSVEGTHEIYSQLVRKVAMEASVPLIDLDQLSQRLLQEFGEERSKDLYLHLAAGEHPNYPEGKVDDTHFSELGARKMAQLVLQEMKRQRLPLIQHIVQR
ncbi:rhamnogalacturonan acetylesterase [Dyadobacter tibetensis]|uniref:rhamnogalacturonan acetylesterase n=1 Tax=Dyadobacter tibetensis TaxID=1211851 RepID=UPI0004AD711E|nr:rhamnogalacturonan acetylesterase [Dyadobacter tibetensis]